MFLLALCARTYHPFFPQSGSELRSSRKPSRVIREGASELGFRFIGPERPPTALCIDHACIDCPAVPVISLQRNTHAIRATGPFGCAIFPMQNLGLDREIGIAPLGDFHSRVKSDESGLEASGCRPSRARVRLARVTAIWECGQWSSPKCFVTRCSRPRTRRRQRAERHAQSSRHHVAPHRFVPSQRLGALRVTQPYLITLRSIAVRASSELAAEPEPARPSPNLMAAILSAIRSYRLPFAVRKSEPEPARAPPVRGPHAQENSASREGHHGGIHQLFRTGPLACGLGANVTICHQTRRFRMMPTPGSASRPAFSASGNTSRPAPPPSCA